MDGPENVALEAARESLEEIHHFWHKAAAAYHEPDTFRHELNALVQATRNLTFRLQAHKSEVYQFDEWYLPWQEFLASNPTLRWVKEARNKVVKQGGLESRSQASIVLTYSHLGPHRREVDVPPTLPTPLLWRAAIEGVPRAVLGNAMLEVTRLWVVDDLPDRELLAAFGDAYLVMDALVDDLARLISERTLEDPAEVLERAVPLDCMASFHEALTLRLNPATGETLEIKAEPFPYDASSGKAAASRYGLEASSSEFDASDPIQYAELVVETSKRILLRDGHHGIFAMLHVPGQGWRQHLVLARDKLEKFVLWREMANNVRTWEADAIVVIGEAWAAPPGSVGDELYPDLSRAKGRLEVLTVNLETKDGRSVMWTTVFEKRRSIRGKRVVLQETVREEFDETPIGFLTPIREVWATSRGGDAQEDEPDP